MEKNEKNGGTETTVGIIVRVSGPTVVAKNMGGSRMGNRIRVGEAGLLGEVIRLEGDRATIQVYEETTGLSLGEEAIDAGAPLLAELGPGLLGAVFDGAQRPLDLIRREQGDFIRRGGAAPALSREKGWDFFPAVKAGEVVGPGDVIGRVAETSRIEHRVMVPPGTHGRVREARRGTMTVTEPVVLLEGGVSITMLQKWPVRAPRPFGKRLPPTLPFITGQRVFDTLFPLAIGGTAIAPGGFGTGKTVVEQTLAKYAQADIIVFVGCGERGNEMTEVLTDFPVLADPVSGRPLMERTILVVNTSNMPVAARETSIYTGVTIAEYYRDMGYHVALMADSISRWAEALREISSRLEEMPGEEGYPTYLGARLAGFYERGGRVVCLGNGHGAGEEGGAGFSQRAEASVGRGETPTGFAGGGGTVAPPIIRIGAVTLVSAISPPGGDFSEPVTQSSMRVAGALWALDPGLAHRRHFPAVDWKRSYSLYREALDPWFREKAADDWPALRRELTGLLQREEELQEIAQLVGMDALQDQERITLEVSRMIREDFLRQSAFSEIDAAAPLEKQYWMLKAFLAYHTFCRDLLKKGAPVEQILSAPVREELGRMKEIPAAGFAERVRALIAGMEREAQAARR